MISKLKEKQKAIELRKKGFSYSEILKEVSVAKSTLSLWLKDVGLSSTQKQRLTDKKLAAMQRGAQIVHRLRMERWNKIKMQASGEINKLSKEERWLMGIALYWAEGSKEKENGRCTPIKFSNSDLSMILIFRDWLREFLDISKENMKYELYIHERADWKSAQKFWALQLKIQPESIRIYFKPHNFNPKRKNIGKKYVGLIRLCVFNSIPLTRKISGWVEGICKNWGVAKW